MIHVYAVLGRPPPTGVPPRLHVELSTPRSGLRAVCKGQPTPGTPIFKYDFPLPSLDSPHESNTRRRAGRFLPHSS